MSALEKHREIWKGKSDEWLFERLDNELKQKVEEIHNLLSQINSMYSREQLISCMKEHYKQGFVEYKNGLDCNPDNKATITNNINIGLKNIENGN